MFDDGNAFDTSLFESNMPELAVKVRERCSKVGFKGISNIKIPYIAATTFAKGRGDTYKNMQDLVFMMSNGKGEMLKATHYMHILEYLYNAKSWNSFTSRLKRVINEFKGKAEKRINKIYYGIFERSVNG